LNSGFYREVTEIRYWRSVAKGGYRSKYVGPFASHGDISVRLKRNLR